MGVRGGMVSGDSPPPSPEGFFDVSSPTYTHLAEVCEAAVTQAAVTATAEGHDDASV